MMMKTLVALTLFVGLTYGQVLAPIPIDDEDPGFRLNPEAEGAQVMLEAFIELNCPDSDYSWPILQQLAEHYGPDNLDVVVHQLPLPYHRQAYLCTQGLNLVRDQQPDATAAYITEIFNNILRFGGFLTRNMNELQVIEMIAEIQEPVTGIDQASFIADFSQYNYATVKQWKYGVRRQGAGTPWFYVNNVDLAVNPSIRLSFNDWLEILDPLFEEENETAEAPKKLMKVEDNIDTSNLKKDKVKEAPKILIKVEDNIDTDNLKKPQDKDKAAKENKTAKETKELKKPIKNAKGTRLATALRKLKGQK